MTLYPSPSVWTTGSHGRWRASVVYTYTSEVWVEKFSIPWGWAADRRQGVALGVQNGSKQELVSWDRTCCVLNPWLCANHLFSLLATWYCRKKGPNVWDGRIQFCWKACCLGECGLNMRGEVGCLFPMSLLSVSLTLPPLCSSSWKIRVWKWWLGTHTLSV